MREVALLEAQQILRAVATASVASLLEDEAPQVTSTRGLSEPLVGKFYLEAFRMEYIAVTAFLAAALSGFMWLLTRNDHSSVFWAQEVRRITAPGSERIAPNKSGSMPRSVMRYFPAIFLMCAIIPSAVAQQRQWTPDDLDFGRPFGDIPIGTTNLTQREFWIFFNRLSAQERAEIRARCAVIGSDQRFVEWARDLCAHVEQIQDSTRNTDQTDFARPKDRPDRQNDIDGGGNVKSG